jgi:hypothetical protein
MKTQVKAFTATEKTQTSAVNLVTDHVNEFCASLEANATIKDIQYISNAGNTGTGGGLWYSVSAMVTYSVAT